MSAVSTIFTPLPKLVWNRLYSVIAVSIDTKFLNCSTVNPVSRVEAKEEPKIKLTSITTAEAGLACINVLTASRSLIEFIVSTNTIPLLFGI